MLGSCPRFCSLPALQGSVREKSSTSASAEQSSNPLYHFPAV